MNFSSRRYSTFKKKKNKTQKKDGDIVSKKYDRKKIEFFLDLLSTPGMETVEEDDYEEDFYASCSESHSHTSSSLHEEEEPSPSYASPLQDSYQANITPLQELTAEIDPTAATKNNNRNIEDESIGISFAEEGEISIIGADDDFSIAADSRLDVTLDPYAIPASTSGDKYEKYNDSDVKEGYYNSYGALPPLTPSYSLDSQSTSTSEDRKSSFGRQQQQQHQHNIVKIDFQNFLSTFQRTNSRSHQSSYSFDGGQKDTLSVTSSMSNMSMSSHYTDYSSDILDLKARKREMERKLRSIESKLEQQR